MNRYRFFTVVLTVSLLLSGITFPETVLAQEPTLAQTLGPYHIRLPLIMSPSSPTQPRTTPGDEWVLTFADEFNQPALDRSVWSSDYGNGNNGELQQYVSDNSRGNYHLSGGALSLIAKKEPYLGRAYTSGIIITRHSFYQKYGRFEMRARLPAGQGLWPAFWLMPNPSGWPPEIDVMESLGHQTDLVYMSVHYRDEQNAHAWSTSAYQGADYSSGWHTFTVDWRPESITWFVDGVEQKRFTEADKIPSMPMFLLANLAVGGHWPGSPDSSTAFPAALEIDYIRAWQHISRYTAPVPSDNQIINPSFDDPNAYPWDYPWSTRNDLNAVFTQAAGGANGSQYAFKASLTQKYTAQPWVVSLSQAGKTLTAGQAYTLTFWARASQARPIRAIIQEQVAPYKEHFAQTVDLTTDWKQYTYTFTAPASTTQAKVIFNLASEIGEVWIDEVGFTLR